MKICKELKYLDNTAVGLGFFDGVHIGHQKLISELVKTAKENDLQSVLVTFKKSPAENFIEHVEYISTNSEKEKLIENLGVDYLFELEFDEELMNLSAQDYLEKKIVEYLNPKYIFTGFNHTFGKNKLGTPEMLAEFATKYGYNYVQIPPIKYENEVVSSTRIRGLLSKGDIEIANKLLYRPYSIEGIVKTGQKLGRTIGFPTINIGYPEQKIKLPFGVYSVTVEIDNSCYKGIMNFGIKPTIESVKKNPIAEVHILNFNKNVYNKPVKINLLKWIREERKFGSIEELKSQIEKDIKNA